METHATDGDDRPWIPKVMSLRRDAVDAVIRYLGPIRVTRDTPPIGQNPAIILRDSMLYRAESVGFRIDLLKAHFSKFSREAGAQYLAAPGDPRFMLQCRNVLTLPQRRRSF